MSIDRGMDKEDVVHTHNGILLSHKKEWNSAICRDVDGPGDCHTEWSKSEREKQTSYNIAYMWNLEKWYRWTHWQSRNKSHRCREQIYSYQGGKGGWDKMGDWDWHIYTIDTMYKIDNQWEPTV